MHAFDYIEKLPGLICVKDRNSVYISVTEPVAKLVGWKHPSHSAGKMDYELPCKASERADIFIRMDKQVIKSAKTMRTLEIAQYTNGWKTFIGERMPIIDSNDKAEGLFTHVIDVSDTFIHSSYAGFCCADGKLFGAESPSTSYLLSTEFKPLPLTDKQENCLFLLIRGKSIKQIARVLQVSPRTIESHLEAIKIKLKCSSKSDLIEKAINLGFIYYIPQAFQNQNIDKMT